MIITLTIVFIVGLCVGSFLNVIIYRWGSEETPTQTLMGRSFCPNCRHQLSWLDNIPLLSFLLLRGKCRYCQKSISPLYPLVELITAIVFVIIIFNNYVHQGAPLQNLFATPPLIQNLCSGGACSTVFGVYSLLFALVFIALFFTDLRFGILPDKITYSAIVIALIYRLTNYAHQGAPLQNSLLQNLCSGGACSTVIVDISAALIAAAIFWLIIKLTKERGMGYGDVKLALLMGLVLGWPKILYSLWFGFILGGIFSAALLLLKRKKIGETIPLGPFLILGLVLSLIFPINFL